MTGQTPALWDAEAGSFDREPDHGLLDPDTRSAWREVLTGALPTAPARIADLGCGTGTLSVLLAEAGHVVDGIDFSPAMVALAEAKATTAAVPASFAVGDASAPQLERASYDVVLSRHVLWALPDPVAAMGRWVDLLAPGGRLVLVEGHWFTDTGLRAREAEQIVRAHRHEVEIVPLADPVLWGKEVTDERYLLLSRR